MITNTSARRWLGLLLAGAIGMCACEKSRQPRQTAEEAVQPAAPLPAAPFQAPVSTSPPVPAHDPLAGPPPTVAEVKEVLRRAYQGALTLDASSGPSFIVGDFNWDRSQDLAVVARPTQGALAAINSEVANWILEDPRRVRVPDFLPRLASMPTPSRVPVAVTDSLLAIVHGHGSAGWRAPGISHFYILKNTGAGSLKAWSRRDFYAATRSAARRVFTVRGDVIGETRDRQPGFLVYAARKYAWYSPLSPHVPLASRGGRPDAR